MNRLELLLAERNPDLLARPWPGRLPDHLSASSITMYQRCREQYRRRYVLGEKERPGAALIWGSADHWAHAEANFRQKILSHEDVPVEDVKLAFAEGFDRAVERNGGESEIAWDEKPHALKDAGAQLAGFYHTTVSPTVQPVAVEEKFTLAVPDVPVPVIGYMDVVTAGPVIERKTAKAKPQGGEPKPDWRIQGLIYQAAQVAQVDWHVSVKTKTPAVYTPVEQPGLTLPYVKAQATAVQRLVTTTVRDLLAIYDEFGPDDPWPGSITHPWACSFCGWKPTCSWWGN